MKKICYFVFTILFSCLLINCVNAQCTNDEISLLKKEADKIKVTYKHLGAVEVEGGLLEYNHFTLTFNKLTTDFNIKDDFGNLLDRDFNSNYITFESDTGTYKYYIISKKCDIILSTINVTLPRFNIYSLDPLCEGISGNDFALCGKYFEHEVSYEYFEKKINDYKRNTDNNKSDEKTAENINISYYLNYLYSYIKEKYVYFIFTFAFILIFFAFIIFIRRKKNRGVLK